MAWKTLDEIDLAGKRVLVVGFMRTGIATARFLVAKGARVTVSERRSRERLGAEADALEAVGVAEPRDQRAVVQGRRRGRHVDGRVGW